MKALAHTCLRWPNLDKNIKKLCRSCQPIRDVKHVPKVAPLRSWTWLSKPWERVHVYLARPFQGTMLFVLVDAHLKRPQVNPMKSTLTSYIVYVLRQIFSLYGLREQLVSDYSPQFISDDFATFIKGNGIFHI